MCRFAAFWFLLDAFRVGGSVQNVLLVFGVNQVAGAVPFTPGGAGVQQALLVKVFAGSAPDRGRGRLLGRPADRDRGRSRRWWGWARSCSSSASARSRRCSTPAAPRARPSERPSAPECCSHEDDSGDRRLRHRQPRARAGWARALSY